MSVIHAPAENPLRPQQLVLPGLLVLGVFGFLFRLWYLQLVLADDLRSQAESTGRISVSTLAPRGRITDREGHVLAAVEPKVVITARPLVVGEKMEVLDKVAAILGADPKKLKRALKQRWQRAGLPVPIYVGATPQQAAMIAEAGESLKGIGVETQAMRKCTEPTLAPHALGWVAAPTAAEEEAMKAKGFVAADYVGRDGVEKFYEQQLMGKAGKSSFSVDAKRRPVRALPGEMPVPGDSLVLSLDSATQRVATQALNGRKGAVVALDPTNGEVICLVSSPDYDLSTFEGGLTEEEADFLYQNPDRPMLKRAISGLYPPGSSFKIVTALAAYHAGKFNDAGSVYCPGYILVGTKKVRCENHPGGSYNFLMAMTKSCNSFFGRLAQRSGDNAIRETAEMIGLGHKTGIDVTGEAGGRFPDEAWIEEAHGRRWSLGDTNNIGIGQGDLEVTPLQMACVAALVANEGVSYKPHLVRQFVPATPGKAPRDFAKEILGKFDADATFWATLKAALRNVVVAGTARGSQIPGIAMSGKTGSAENPHSSRTHAWFVGYAPSENPRIAFAVVLETAGHGGDVAAPVARQVVQTYLNPNRKVQPPSSAKPFVRVSALPDSPESR